MVLPHTHLPPAEGQKMAHPQSNSDQSMVITLIPSEAKVSNKVEEISAQKGLSVQYGQYINHITLTEVIRATAKAGVNDLCVRHLSIARYLNCLQK
jgi:hypothetical protein